MPGQWYDGTYWPDHSDQTGPPRRPRGFGCMTLLLCAVVAILMGAAVLLVAKMFGLTL
jgi:hypothetical protein